MDLRSDDRAQFANHTLETVGGFMQTEIEMLEMQEMSWKERYFVYVFALLGFLFFWLVKMNSSNFADTRKKLLRNIAALNAVKVDEENWQSYIPSSF
jgi:hypothetical protein